MHKCYSIKNIQVTQFIEKVLQQRFLSCYGKRQNKTECHQRHFGLMTWTQKDAYDALTGIDVKRTIKLIFIFSLQCVYPNKPDPHYFIFYLLSNFTILQFSFKTHPILKKGNAIYLF